MRITLHPLPPEHFRERVGELLLVFVRAMNYPWFTIPRRSDTWRAQTTRSGFRAVAAAMDPTDKAHYTPGVPVDIVIDDAPPPPHHSIVGIAYACTGSPTYWWHQQIVTALLLRGESEAAAILHSPYCELSELHVDPFLQGVGAGRALLAAILANRPEPCTILSTPEVPDEGNRAWQLYRSMGFEDLARGVRFTGDSRPFGILRRPSSAPPAQAPRAAAHL